MKWKSKREQKAKTGGIERANDAQWGRGVAEGQERKLQGETEQEE